jgi:hypothetical protein
MHFYIIRRPYKYTCNLIFLHQVGGTESKSYTNKLKSSAVGLLSSKSGLFGCLLNVVRYDYETTKNKQCQLVRVEEGTQRFPPRTL